VLADFSSAKWRAIIAGTPAALLSMLNRSDWRASSAGGQPGRGQKHRRQRRPFRHATSPEFRGADSQLFCANFFRPAQ
jgi:hypothetical protein